MKQKQLDAPQGAENSIVHISLGDEIDQLHRQKMCSVTAHASADGYAMIIHGQAEAGKITVELATACAYGGEVQVLRGEQVVLVLGHHGEHWPNGYRSEKNNKVESEGGWDYESFREAAKALSSFRAFGSESNFQELAEERINYNIRAEEEGFLIETIDFGDGRRLKAPGELRGFKEMDNPNGIKGELLEPVTVDEVVSFLKALKVDVDLKEELNLLTNPNVSFERKESLKESLKHYLQPILETVLEKTEKVNEAGLLPKLLKAIKLSSDDYRRLYVSAERQNIGGNWCYESPNGIGEREGVTKEQSRQNDDNFTKMDQYHLPGERVDGKLIFSQELLIAEKVSYFYSMYNIEEKGPDGQPKVRSWAEQSLYLQRCARERDKLFAEKLWRVLTWPLSLLEKLFPQLEQEYKDSVRKNSPGPNREYVNNRWQSAPLRGKEAIEHLKANPGTLKGKRVSKEVSILIGQRWHKLMLTKSHMKSLRESMDWRRGIMHVQVGEETVTEPFKQDYEGLPIEYVIKKYGRKSQ